MEYCTFYNGKVYTFEVCGPCQETIRLETHKQKLIANAEHDLKQSLSGAIKGSLTVLGYPYNGDVFNYLSYTPHDLKNHIEKQFEPWMAWWNRGRYIVNHWNDNDPATWKWQIDHIIPRSTFQYASMADDDFHECWSLSNLRPLSAKQNLLDGTRRTRH